MQMNLLSAGLCSLLFIGCKLDGNNSTTKGLAPPVVYRSATMHGSPITDQQKRQIMIAMQKIQTDTMIAQNSNQQHQNSSPSTINSNGTQPVGNSGVTGFTLAAGDTPYMLTCRQKGVPIPPPWGDAGWKYVKQLPADRIFALDPTFPTHLYTYQDDKGTCAALPRLDPVTGGIFALGMICQSKAGNACFWDNADPADQTVKFSEPKQIRPEFMADGSNLWENCTECHRGANIFVVHAGTALESIPDRDPTGPAVPIGQPDWINPAGDAKFAENCQTCHVLPKFSFGYCSNVMMPSIRGTSGKPTMPPAGEDRNEYLKDIEQIEATCKKIFDDAKTVWPY